MQLKSQKLCKCMIKNMLRTLFTLAVVAQIGTAWAAQAVPADMNGRKVHFSYPASWKFTPLLIAFGEAEPGRPNTYMLRGEDRSCFVAYNPNSSAGTAELSVRGKRDKATISMRFITDTCGTARMIWNGVDYKLLNFRLEADADRHDYLCRMGDPVGDVMPPTLSGKVLVIDFSGAFGGKFNPDTGEIDYKEWDSSPWVVTFPLSGEQGTAQLPEEKTLVSAIYEPMGCGAMVSLKGGEIAGEILLDFATSESGLARVDWTKEDICHVVCAARFSIRAVEPGIRELLDDLSNAKYATAVERLYQKRLLMLLPEIMQGASVDTVLPDANGTTALHNACGLSHVEIVRWLVEHGANLNAKTARGASVDDCIGGPNARAIRAILRNARNSK